LAAAAERHVSVATGSGGGTSGGATASGTSGTTSEREAIFRWRDRQYYGGPKRWLESALRDPAWQDKDDSNDAKKSASAANAASAAAEANQSPLWLGDDLEFWPEKAKGEKVKFVQIAALHNELVAVSDRGHLYQWRWSDMTPCRHDNPSGNHPRYFYDFYLMTSEVRARSTFGAKMQIS
jgi:E3 ubiquitin-protein ligase EDD1